MTKHVKLAVAMAFVTLAVILFCVYWGTPSAPVDTTVQISPRNWHGTPGEFRQFNQQVEATNRKWEKGFAEYKATAWAIVVVVLLIAAAFVLIPEILERRRAKQP